MPGARTEFRMLAAVLACVLLGAASNAPAGPWPKYSRPESSAMVLDAAMTPRTTATMILVHMFQFRGGLQGGGVASLHNPVRASGSAAPGVSSLGMVVTQPHTSQAASASLVIIFMDPSQRRASRCVHTPDYPTMSATMEKVSRCCAF